MCDTEMSFDGDDYRAVEPSLAYFHEDDIVWMAYIKKRNSSNTSDVIVQLYNKLTLTSTSLGISSNMDYSHNHTGGFRPNKIKWVIAFGGTTLRQTPSILAIDRTMVIIAWVDGQDVKVKSLIGDYVTEIDDIFEFRINFDRWGPSSTVSTSISANRAYNNPILYKIAIDYFLIGIVWGYIDDTTASSGSDQYTQIENRILFAIPNFSDYELFAFPPARDAFSTGDVMKIASDSSSHRLHHRIVDTDGSGKYNNSYITFYYENCPVLVTTKENSGTCDPFNSKLCIPYKRVWHPRLIFSSLENGNTDTSDYPVFIAWLNTNLTKANMTTKSYEGVQVLESEVTQMSSNESIESRLRSLRSNYIKNVKQTMINPFQSNMETHLNFITYETWPYLPTTSGDVYTDENFTIPVGYIEIGALTYHPITNSYTDSTYPVVYQDNDNTCPKGALNGSFENLTYYQQAMFTDYVDNVDNVNYCPILEQVRQNKLVSATETD